MAKEDHAETPTLGGSNEKIPLRLKMIDALIDQANVSAHITLSGIKWVQDIYMYGVRMMAETGRAIEDGCRIKIPLREEAAEYAEKTTSALLKVQSNLLKMSIHSILKTAELLRDVLAENRPGGKEAGPAQRKQGATNTTPFP
jgi:pyrrolidone-carboxylate peptidase